MPAQFQGKVELISEKPVFEGFLRIIAARVKYDDFSGKMVGPDRDILCMERGDAVAALIHNTKDGTVLIVEQFRYPTFHKTGGWLFETPAGKIDGDEYPEEAVRREVDEETGFEVANVQRISTFYVSPGGTSERIHLFYIPVSPEDEKSQGGGLIEHSEYIRRHFIPVSEAFEMVQRGLIHDAKTIIALQWLQLQMKK